MSNVVFTGRATDPLGNFVERGTLASMARDRGWYMRDHVDFTTDLLVASRTDTIKAKAARERGIEVINYTQFFERLGLGIVPTNTRAAPAARQGVALPSRASGARFVGTARPENPSVGDVWQPGGDGPIYDAVARPGIRTAAWQLRQQSPEEQIAEWQEAQEVAQMMREPRHYTDSVFPPNPNVGDTWTFSTLAAVFTETGWEVRTGMDLLEGTVRRSIREPQSTLAQPNKAFFQFASLHLPEFVATWRNDERLKMNREAEEAERVRMERAPRTNFITPKRSLDL